MWTNTIKAQSKMNWPRLCAIFSSEAEYDQNKWAEDPNFWFQIHRISSLGPVTGYVNLNMFCHLCKPQFPHL